MVLNKALEVKYHRIFFLAQWITNKHLYSFRICYCLSDSLGGTLVSSWPSPRCLKRCSLTSFAQSLPSASTSPLGPDSEPHLGLSSVLCPSLFFLGPQEEKFLGGRSKVEIMGALPGPISKHLEENPGLKSVAYRHRYFLKLRKATWEI